MLAAPVSAQTITAPGMIGQPACAGPGETDDPVSGSVSNITANSANTTTDLYSNLYGALRAQAGDGGPTSFPLTLYIRNAITNAVVVNNAYRLSISSSNQDLIAVSAAHTLSPKTAYVVTLETSASGFGESRPLLRRCFMTGGTYTPSNESGQPGFDNTASSGCFSISPLTRLDVRNCLCGRSRIWNDDAQNTTARQNLGCAN